MDTLSHLLIGRLLAASSTRSRKEKWLIAAFAALPDLTQIPIYLYIGFLHHRPLWIPFNIDWDGFRALHPVWSMLWEVPHSVFFVFLVVLPLVLYFRLPKMAFVAYCSHIVVDLFSHFGEWAVKPLYPFPFMWHGWTNGWAWSVWQMALSWLVLILFIAGAEFLTKRIKSRTVQSNTKE